MRLGKLTIHGITRFKEPLVVDFAEFGPGTVGIHGSNGAGKSSLLECSGAGALYRELPRKDALAALGEWLNAQVPAPFLHLTFQAAQYYFDILHTFGKAAAAHLKKNDEPLTTGKMRDFGIEIEELFGPSKAFYAGPFASQRGEGHFGALGLADRRDLFRHYLDLGRLQVVHDLAADRSKKASVYPQEVARRQNELTTLTNRLTALGPELDEARDAVAHAKVLTDDAQARFDAISADAALITAVETYRKSLKRVVEAQQKVGDFGDVPVVTQAVVDAAEEHWRDLVSKDAEIRRLQGEVDKKLSPMQRASDDLQRAIKAADRLSRVPCHGDGIYASCELLKDAVQARDSLDDLRARATKTAASFAEAERLLVDAHSPAKGAIADARKELERFREDLKRAEGFIRLHEALADAKEQSRALRKGLPSPLPVLPSSQDVKAARDALEAQRKAVEEAQRKVSLLQAERDHAETRIGHLKNDLAEDAKKFRRLAGLDLLAKAFGPHGVQALEIDAAGPTVAALANDLLDAAYGGRFTMEIRTQRLLKSQKGTAEDFSVVVHDRKRGRTALLSAYSGGEQVILDEALRNAFSLFSSDRSPAKYRIETLWRDELPSRLYEGNVARYTSMLARARQIGNFHQVLFVGSKDEVEGADVVLHLREDGKVERTK